MAFKIKTFKKFGQPKQEIKLKQYEYAVIYQGNKQIVVSQDKKKQVWAGNGEDNRIFAKRLTY